MKHYRDDSLVLNPGSLRHQVIIQQPTYAKGTSGADEPTWSTFVSGKAFFDSPRARKYFASDRENVSKTYGVEMHWQAGIDETMRLLFSGRTFEIMDSVDVEERHRITYLHVQEIL